MEQNSILIFVESRYKVNRKRIKSTINRVLKAQNINSNTEVSVAIIGNRKMRELNKKYRGMDKTTNVLSFSQTEGEVITVTPDTMHLGDIVLSYPVVIMDAARDDMLVDDKIDELVEHGLLHLLGIHH